MLSREIGSPFCRSKSVTDELSILEDSVAKKKIKAKPKPAPQKAGYQNVFDKHPVWISAIFIFIVLLIFYHQVMLGGKTFESPDKMNSWAVVHFAEQALQENGAIPLWCPFLFSGMPSYGSMLTVPKVNLIDHVLRSYVLNPKLKLIPEPFTFLFLNYLLFALFMYALMRSQKVSPLVALFAGATIIFMPQFIAFTAYGHNTKFLSACLIPLILLFSHKLLEKRNAFYFSLTALAIGYQMMRAHVQVSYYTFLAIGIYFLFTAIADFKEKKSVKQLLASTVLLAGAVTAGILLSAVIYTSVLDYQKFSIRGGGASGGLDFDYASSWSFHPLEMVTFFIPSFMGFGGQTYWGKMPWTDYPLYFSIIVFFLAGLAFVLRRDRRTWFWGVIAGFSLVVSFGNHLPLLYTPMFKFLPFFNKFRIPSMIHILFDIAMVVLAACGLQALLATRPATSDAKKGSDVPPKVKK